MILTRKFGISLCLCFMLFSAFAQKKYKVHTIAFYNTENLYDATDDPAVNDAEFLPDGAESWTEEKYKTKLENIAKVISETGVGENPDPPTIIGLAEIENRGVLEDLVQQPVIAGRGYGIVHFESPDHRGIDVALLYQKSQFKPTSHKKIPLIITADKEPDADKNMQDDNLTADSQTRRIFTRDILLVTGLLNNEEMHFIVNHWPSRSGGEKKSRPYRDAAAALNRKIVDSLYAINPIAKIIIMGDFNDGPYDNSLKNVLQATGRKEDAKKYGLYNPMAAFLEEGIGTVAYKDAWDVFDQMIVSWPLTEKEYASFRYWKAAVFNKPYLTQQNGKYKGYPLRNSNGEAGYSDHFPVYLYLIKQM